MTRAYMESKIPLHISVTLQQQAALRAETEGRGCSVAAIVCQALDAFLVTTGKPSHAEKA